ncbi:MAG TPA: hypothetical protein PK771_16025, partial [Spirochaetota bacterium]|nr:hypothetical protein [Spirochaetota bacterium]
MRFKNFIVGVFFVLFLTVRVFGEDLKPEIKIQTGHIGEKIEDLCFSKDGKIFLSRSYNGDVRIWHTETGKLIKSYNNVKDKDYYYIEKSYNGDPIVVYGIGNYYDYGEYSSYKYCINIYDDTTSDFKNVLFKDSEEASLIMNLNGSSGQHWLSDDHKYLLIKNDVNWDIKIYFIDKGKANLTFSKKYDFYPEVKLSPDGKYFMVLIHTKTKLYDFYGKEIFSFDNINTGGKYWLTKLNNAFFTKDGKYIFFTSLYRTGDNVDNFREWSGVKIFRLSDYSFIDTEFNISLEYQYLLKRRNEPMISLAVNSVNSMIITGTNDSVIKLWDTKNNSCKYTLQRDTGEFKANFLKDKKKYFIWLGKKGDSDSKSI